MIRMCRLLICCLLAWASSCLAADGSVAVERQVLVMLHLPAPHFRPDGNYSGGYANDIGRSARRRIALELANAHGLKLVGDWPMPVLGIDCYVMEQSAAGASAQIIESLSKDPRVEWAQAMAVFHTLGAAEPLSPVQPSARFWHTPEIHKVTTGRNVRIAVVDSGIDDKHPDLAGQLAIKENFVDGNPYLGETHGTEVAGIIAARAGNGIGIEGVAPDARLMALRACWQDKSATQCSSFTLGKALNFAIVHDAQVINLSLTGPRDRLFERLLDAAQARGIKVVGAVDPKSADGGFPANYPGVLAVAEEKEKGLGAAVLLAPGRDIPTTVPGARWGFVSGSSYAAAHVSGMVALLTQLQPSLKPAQIREAIVVNSLDGIRPAGTIDACATIARVSATCACSCTTNHASKANN